MLPKYYRHVGDHENTLITKFFGLHRITLRGGKKVSPVTYLELLFSSFKLNRYIFPYFV